MITIVVLIILASVAINLTLGNNGIFNRARTATEQYQNAQEYEDTQIAKYTNEINSYVGGYRGFSPISYSTEEQDTGLKWIDGKKIYQKTVGNLNFSMDWNSYYYTIAWIEPIVSNVDTYISGFFLRNDIKTGAPVTIISSDTNHPNKIGVQSYLSGTGNILTIQYTKTTD